MKIYRLTWIECDIGTCLSWHSSKRDAQKAKAEILDDDAEIDMVEFPKTKKKVIDWLNIYFNTDNG